MSKLSQAAVDPDTAKGGLDKALDAAYDADVVTSTFGTLADRVVLYVTGFVGLLAMLALVVGALMYVTSFGDDQRVAVAKKVIIGAVIGLAVSILAFVIVSTVARILA